MTQSQKKVIVKGKGRLEITDDYPIQDFKDLKDLPFEKTDTPEGLHEFIKVCMKKLAEGKISGWRYNGLIYGVNTMIRISGTAPQEVRELEERINAVEEEAKQVVKVNRVT